MKPEKQLRNRQRGSIIVWFALFMVTMLGFTALGVDVAKLASTRTQLQNAADAAALAGASAINAEDGRILRDEAVARAQAVSLQNEAFVDSPQPVYLDPADIQFLPRNEVQVTVRRQGASAMVTSMAHVLGVKSLEMTATAVARPDTAQAVCALVPIGVYAPPSGPDFRTGCGQNYTLRLNGGVGSSTSYTAIIYPPCYEGPCAEMAPEAVRTFECLMRNNYRCCISFKEFVYTQPRDVSAQMRQTINQRFVEDTDSREGICYAQYNGNGKRLLYVPIITYPVPGDGGAWVHGFTAFFVKTRITPGPGTFLVGEFVNAIAPGVGGGSGARGPAAYTVRLVR